jgi:hypothetical protein
MEHLRTYVRPRSQTRSERCSVPPAETCPTRSQSCSPDMPASARSPVRLRRMAGGVGEAGAAGEEIPREGAGSEEGRGGALGAMPFDLQLPGAVAGGHQALGAGEFEGAGGAQVGDAPGVAVQCGRHPVTSHGFRLALPKLFGRSYATHGGAPWGTATDGRARS